MKLTPDGSHLDRPAALVTYDGLPVSAGGAHHIRGTDPNAEWQTMSAFLSRFTTFEAPDELGLALFEGHGVSPAFFARSRSVVTSAFGKPQRDRAWYASPPLGERYVHTWQLEYAQLERAISLLGEIGPVPPDGFGGPVSIGARATFRLRDPLTGQVLPGQGAELYGNQETDFRLFLGLSVMHLRLAWPSTCALFLSLPFTEVTPALRSYAANLSRGLPFRLSRKHWALWRLNAKGTRYYSRRASVLEAGRESTGRRARPRSSDTSGRPPIRTR